MTRQAVTIRKALYEAARDLHSAGIETSVLDAQVLLGEVLHKNRTALIASEPFEQLSLEQYKRYRSLLELRCSGECVAYLIGRREFWGLDIQVGQAVLVPRPETETLVEAALSLLVPDSKSTVLDLCTGSGAVAVALKHERPGCTIYASDISKDALVVAQENARLLCENAITFIHSDLFEHITGSFDLITANPPYIPTDLIKLLPPEVQHEPIIALDGGLDGLSLIRKLIAQAAAYLAPGASLLIEADPSQMPKLKQLFALNAYQDIRFWHDLSARQRVIGGNTKQ
ncbi:MAG: peptide chain release factor N(5)-glutamine methyltransferase [Spirochaetaceae bacterium]|jgi:release factor glutamine methyltransferase|nr:peptide chain release factor N(5)-glutamine methyltransferase [Spirochaetaceae bacterium]